MCADPVRGYPVRIYSFTLDACPRLYGENLLVHTWRSFTARQMVSVHPQLDGAVYHLWRGMRVPGASGTLTNKRKVSHRSQYLVKHWEVCVSGVDIPLLSHPQLRTCVFSIVSMLGQGLRRCPSIETALNIVLFSISNVRHLGWRWGAHC